ncbi:extensin family protein [Novosphingobium mangrovi (ex Hu et al. 2023)]|uniref:Extensin family protein n=1 Tax=Novosphingobium mangrovi (ex Hu et al. 2023) TaxID=2930094 RepID=A0ABT0AHA7_9SPHN|nr:extensin family protein [Novosphingobium mangrovi (ex Hu et al. 2023)]MCJ1962576.1 extensin family protein [Novosphingobium mangrovi (ex Hu et al. 2023)]
MRRNLLILPLVGLLGACIGSPSPPAPQRESARASQSSRPSRAYSRPSPAFGQCLSALSAQHAAFQPLDDKYFGKGCSTVNTVRLSSLASDTASLGLTNLGPVTCTVATGFAGWARFGVDRAAEQILGSRIARIETFGSYNCRNVAGTAKRSGHATANAIDVSAFVLADGRRVSVLNDWDAGSRAEKRFLRVVHESACKRFGMVLGPDYNAAHANHFHLEATSGSYCR